MLERIRASNVKEEDAYNHTTSCGELVKDRGEGGKGILTPQDRFLIDVKLRNK
jgi:hypothetical protein